MGDVPSLARDYVVLRSPDRHHTRTVVFTRGSSTVFTDERAVILEYVPVAEDGTVLHAVEETGHTDVTIIDDQRVLYVGALVKDQHGWDNYIRRNEPPTTVQDWE